MQKFLHNGRWINKEEYILVRAKVNGVKEEGKVEVKEEKAERIEEKAEGSVDYLSMEQDELVKLAKEQGIKAPHFMKKETLISKLK